MLCDVDTFVKEMNGMKVPMIDVDNLITSYLTVRTPEAFNIDPSDLKVDPNIFKRDQLVGYLWLNKKQGFMRTIFLEPGDYDLIEDKKQSFIIEIHEIYKRICN